MRQLLFTIFIVSAGTMTTFAQTAAPLVCGQAMTFLRLEKEDLVPGIKQALNAQTVISSYQLKNFVYFDMSLTE